jgi:hypothetical protein
LTSAVRHHPRWFSSIHWSFGHPYRLQHMTLVDCVVPERNVGLIRLINLDWLGKAVTAFRTPYCTINHFDWTTSKKIAAVTSWSFRP